VTLTHLLCSGAALLLLRLVRLLAGGAEGLVAVVLPVLVRRIAGLVLVEHGRVVLRSLRVVGGGDGAVSHVGSSRCGVPYAGATKGGLSRARPHVLGQRWVATIEAEHEAPVRGFRL